MLLLLKKRATRIVALVCTELIMPLLPPTFPESIKKNFFNATLMLVVPVVKIVVVIVVVVVVVVVVITPVLAAICGCSTVNLEFFVVDEFLQSY